VFENQQIISEFERTYIY